MRIIITATTKIEIVFDGKTNLCICPIYIALYSRGLLSASYLFYFSPCPIYIAFCVRGGLLSASCTKSSYLSRCLIYKALRLRGDLLFASRS